MNVILAEPSYIIRKGFIHLLNEFKDIVTIKECSTTCELEKSIQEMKGGIIIANTTFDISIQDEAQENNADLQILLFLFNSPLPHGSSQNHLSICESKATLIEKIQRAIDYCKNSESGDSSEELSPREKLVLKHVALGLTNKEIADQLFISTHTVISHRKNITKKLGIKTVSGLTVYAILNKLIGMEDVG